MMQDEAVVRRYFEAGDRNDLDAWDTLCAPDMILDPGFAEPVRGLAAIKQFTAAMHQAFSDFSLTVDELVAEGEWITVRWTTRGIHTAPLMSPAGLIPPTGKVITMRGTSTVRVASGRIVEERVVVDLADVMRQLGVMPATEQASASPTAS